MLLRPFLNHTRSFYRMVGKHALDSTPKGPKKFKKRKIKTIAEGSGEDILVTDVKTLLTKYSAVKEEGKDGDTELGFKRFDEIEVDIEEFSSLGLDPLS